MKRIMIVAAFLALAAPVMAATYGAQVNVTGTYIQQEMFADTWDQRYAAEILATADWGRVGIRGGATGTYLHDAQSGFLVGTEGGLIVSGGSMFRAYAGTGLAQTEMASGAIETRPLYRIGVYARMLPVRSAMLEVGVGVRYMDLGGGAELAPWLSVGWAGK